MTGHVMEGLLKLSFTPAEFTVWMRDVVKPKMQWHPQGWVRHHTLTLVWPGFDVRGNKLTPAQRIENMSVDWVSRGMTKAPHFLVGTDNLIHVMWPPWLPGQHAIGANHDRLGIENAGNFDLQPFPDKMLQTNLHLIQTTSELFDIPVNTGTLRDHSQYQKKACPGKNMGSVASWIAEIKKNQPLGPEIDVHDHRHFLPVPELAIDAIKREEAFRAKAYDDRGRPAIGYGRRDGYRGFSLTLGMVVTEAQATAWLREDAAVLADTIQQILTHKPTQGQLAALVICAYNIGTNALSTSSMVRLFNAGDFIGAADSFLLWNKATNPVTKVKEVLAGLTKRRERERSVFLGGNPYAPVIVPVAPQPAPKPVPVVVVAKPSPPVQAPPALKPVPPPTVSVKNWTIVNPSKPIQPAPWWVRALNWLLTQLTKP